MFLVKFVNFAYTKDFDTQERAMAYMERSGFETVLMTNSGQVLSEFSPISGFKKPVKFTDTFLMQRID